MPHIFGSLSLDPESPLQHPHRSQAAFLWRSELMCNIWSFQCHSADTLIHDDEFRSVFVQTYDLNWKKRLGRWDWTRFLIKTVRVYKMINNRYNKVCGEFCKSVCDCSCSCQIIPRKSSNERPVIKEHTHTYRGQEEIVLFIRIVSIAVDFSSDRTLRL